jgi:membrane fusion protein, multidrug efflux system
MKKIGKLLALCSLFLVLLTGCRKGEEKDEDVPENQVNVQVETATVKTGDIRHLVEASGSLTALPNQDVKVSALVAGRVSAVDNLEGDPVSKGSLIARLDASTYDDQLRQAKATLENARSNQQREQTLFERGISARKEWEDAQRDFVVAQAAYNTALAQVSRTQVRSPISGVIVKRFVNVGEQVDGTASQPIFEVGNFDPIELIANVQATLLPYLKEGESADVKTDAFGQTIFNGQIVSILPAVDPANNMAAIRIRIANNDHRLRGGMFATASIIAEVHSNAVYVPAAAISPNDNIPTIFIVKPDSTVEQRRVQVGWRDGDRVEVLSNARAGETVVTTGSYGLADKMRVTVKKNSTNGSPS